MSNVRLLKLYCCYDQVMLIVNENKIWFYLHLCCYHISEHHYVFCHIIFLLRLFSQSKTIKDMLFYVLVVKDVGFDFYLVAKVVSLSILFSIFQKDINAINFIFKIGDLYQLFWKFINIVIFLSFQFWLNDFLCIFFIDLSYLLFTYLNFWLSQQAL